MASFKQGTFETYKNLKEEAFKNFGDIRENKESYYLFRNWFNENYFDKGKDLQSEGFYFHFLMNSCINSLVRIGPNGFNQSFGNRFFFMDEKEFNKIKERLNKNVILTSMDYHRILDEFDSEKAVIFLDPPYFARNEVGYQKTYQEDDLKKFIEHIKRLKGKVIYTDIKCQLHDELGWHAENTKMLSNISPLRRNETENQEVFFSNFTPENKKNTVSLF